MGLYINTFFVIQIYINIVTLCHNIGLHQRKPAINQNNTTAEETIHFLKCINN